MSSDLIIDLFYCLLVVAASIGGLLAVRRWLKAADLATHHDVTDPMSQVVGMMFAVLLGFMVSDAMQRFENARSVVQQEAASLADVYRLSHGLRPDVRHKIEQLCSDYNDYVVDQEWKLMEEKKSSKDAWKSYSDLWAACTDFKPVDQGEANIQQVLLGSMNAVGDNRRMRIEALHNSIPPIMWWVLIAGGVATVLFTYFFGISNIRLQIIMTSIVSLTISLNFFLLASYDDPFLGDVSISPAPFIVDRQLFKVGTVSPDFEIR